MRSKYLKKLLDLITEMQADLRQFDIMEKALLGALRAVFSAFWFSQMDDLWQHIAAWKLRITETVSEEALFLAYDFLEAETAEIAAANAVASMVTEEEAAADIEERIDRILQK